MKAVVISKMGRPEELVLSNVPEPVPGPDQALEGRATTGKVILRPR